MATSQQLLRQTVAFLGETRRVSRFRQALPLGDVKSHVPAVEPVLTDVTLDHKPAHIVGLPADTVQRDRRHLPTVPKQRRNEAGRGFNTSVRK